MRMKGIRLPEIQINCERVLRDLYKLREVGKYKSGVHRPTLSEPDIWVRKWLKEQLNSIGFESKIDGIANVIGYSPGPGKKLLTGSHLETQNRSGWLDGVLGVIYALETARAIHEAGRHVIGIDVFAFSDEEGHFGSFLGSRSLIGQVTKKEVDAARDRNTGTPLSEALVNANLQGVTREVLNPERYFGMFEAHIEQGLILEQNAKSIGVVETIVGSKQFKVIAKGQQNHAGTTPMDMRRDAGRAILNVHRRLETVLPSLISDKTVWTVGKIHFHPNQPSIIPGYAEMTVQIRDPSRDILSSLKLELQKVVRDEAEVSPCNLELSLESESLPARMDKDLTSILEAVADKVTPSGYMKMNSGAGHDARTFSAIMPTSMMFVPSIGGLSHHHNENTSDEHIKLGARVYSEAAIAMISSTNLGF